MACVASPAPSLVLNGTLQARLVIEEEPAEPMTRDGAPVFRVARGNPDLENLTNTRPQSVISDSEAKQYACDIDVQHHSYSGRVNDGNIPLSIGSKLRYPYMNTEVTCETPCNCPNGSTWSPVYVDMPVFTAIAKAKDGTEDLYYVMDLIKTAVACACQR